MDLRTVTKDSIWLICLESVNKKAAFKIFPLLALSEEKKMPVGGNWLEG